MRFSDKIAHVRAKAIKICIKIVNQESTITEPFELWQSLLEDATYMMRD